MKIRWLTIIALALAAGVAAFVVTRRVTCGRRGTPPDYLEDVSRLQQELKLSAEQMAKIGQLHADLSDALDEACARHCAARAQLGRILAAETNASAEADALVAEMGRAYEEGERATLRQIRQVRDVLTPEQRQRFSKMVGDCMCGGCNMPGAMPAKAGASCPAHSTP